MNKKYVLWTFVLNRFKGNSDVQNINTTIKTDAIRVRTRIAHNNSTMDVSLHHISLPSSPGGREASEGSEETWRIKG